MKLDFPEPFGPMSTFKLSRAMGSVFDPKDSRLRGLTSLIINLSLPPALIISPSLPIAHLVPAKQYVIWLVAFLYSTFLKKIWIR